MTGADPAGAPVRCPHRRFSGADCAGELLPGGYCTRCGRHRDGPRLPVPDGGPARPLELPELPAKDADNSVLSENAPLAYGRRCGNKACGAALAPPLVEPPVPNEGHCPACGHRYSFVPRLREGDVLGQYRVRGCLAHGGQGWVHLAANTRLDDTPVAVKELLNRHDERLAELAESERRYLIALDHPDIVRILDYLREERGGGEQPMNYIVMEYVGSNTLEQIIREVRRGKRRLDIEEVLTYGCRILDALGHLHRRQEPIGPLAYCDMKPSNVIHYRNGLKVIDLGGVRRIGERTAPAVTEGFAAPEVDRTGPTVAHDLHTVGRTLQELARFAATGDIPGTGITSFRYAVECATAVQPDDRFASAAEMSEQLRGVLREIRALRTKQDRPEPSTLFEPTRRLLDGGLGTLPSIDRWLARTTPRRRARPVSEPLDAGPPKAGDVALALPVPGPHPSDEQRSLFRLSTYDPDRELQQPDERSAEICFHNVRLHLRKTTAPDLTKAEEELAEARRILADSPHRAWQTEWYEGLLDLVRAQNAADGAAADGAAADTTPGGEGDAAHEKSPEVVALDRAYGHFEAVYRRLPGEYAPKLALGYCAERLAGAGARAASGRTPEELHRIAADHYRAVWSRNRMQGNGAFGLARLALARGSRADAVQALRKIPEDSPDYDAAWIASVRVEAARLRQCDPALPTLRDIGRARHRLADAARKKKNAPRHLGPEHGLLLEAELLEWALDLVTGPGADDADGTHDAHDTDGTDDATGFSFGELFGDTYHPRAGERPLPRVLPARRAARPDSPEWGIRLLLAACYRKLSRQRRDGDRAKLVELHHAVRPPTLA